MTTEENLLQVSRRIDDPLLIGYDRAMELVEHAREAGWGEPLVSQAILGSYCMEWTVGEREILVAVWRNSGHCDVQIDRKMLCLSTANVQRLMEEL